MPSSLRRVPVCLALVALFAGCHGRRYAAPAAAPATTAHAPAYPTPTRTTSGYVDTSAATASRGGGYAGSSASPTSWSGGGVAFEGQDLPFDQVLAKSRATGKPALLYFTTSWCGYCRKLERETLPSPLVARHVSGYVNVAYGADGGVGRQLADRYGVHGFPTLVRVDASGRATGVYEGFDPPESFVQRIPAP